MKRAVSLLLLACCLCTACSVNKQVARQANRLLIRDTAISKGFIGISIYDPAAGKYLYNYNADKYFVPASNTKLFTLYAGLKYLGDSLVGLRYQLTDTSVKIFPTGDPTFLLPEFKTQQVFDFLADQKNISFCSQLFTEHLGNGWAWNDYMDTYMAQRSEFPIYGNLARVYTKNNLFSIIPGRIRLQVQPGLEDQQPGIEYSLYKDWTLNEVHIMMKSNRKTERTILEIPFTPGLHEVPVFLSDTLKQPVYFTTNKIEDSMENNDKRLHVIHSQPTDSLFKPMMHRSDNFFAEQTLLMAANEHTGFMSDETMIDTLLKKELEAMPQKPRWVDGSGLSRYNLFTPQSFVYILNIMKDEFGLERMKNILPTGGEGTLKNYYVKEAGMIYAKTGTLSNNCALSGYLITKKNKVLIFSILANNYQTGATPVRRAVEQFLQDLRDKY
jgi:serine-type D-Ala-D-Ala carboxypeptidase/endopeptidase (penicillin-binding protein 4)